MEQGAGGGGGAGGDEGEGRSGDGGGDDGDGGEDGSGGADGGGAGGDGSDGGCGDVGCGGGGEGKRGDTGNGAPVCSVDALGLVTVSARARVWSPRWHNTSRRAMVQNTVQCGTNHEDFFLEVVLEGDFYF